MKRTAKQVAGSLAVLAAVAACAVLGAWVRLQVRIDSCLDRGGRWDHVHAACETQASP